MKKQLKSLIEACEKLDSMKNIIRYSNINRVKNENNAEHSFIVACIVNELSHLYRFDKVKAFHMALYHDIGEIYTTDIPRNVKHRHKHMHDEIKRAELKSIKYNFDGLTYLNIEEYFEQKTFVSWIVKLADHLSCYTYTKQELRYDAKNSLMRNANNESYDCINKLYYKIEKIAKGNHKYRWNER